MSTEDRAPVLAAMVRHGTAFACALAKAWQIADPIQADQLEREFGGLADTYLSFVEART